MGFDVFNALDLMNNKEFLEKLKFGIGDGNLQYYLYNWKCPYMEPHQVGFSDTIFRPLLVLTPESTIGLPSVFEYCLSVCMSFEIWIPR